MGLKIFQDKLKIRKNGEKGAKKEYLYSSFIQKERPDRAKYKPERPYALPSRANNPDCKRRKRW